MSLVVTDDIAKFNAAKKNELMYIRSYFEIKSSRFGSSTKMHLVEVS